MNTPSRPWSPALFGAIFSLILLALGTHAFAEDNQGPPAGLGMARVTFIQGDTSFNSLDTEDWAALSPNFSLRNGDRLWAGDGSKIEVQFSGGHMAWVNYQTELDITRMERDRGRALQVAVASGEASFATRHMGPDDVFQADTPNASVRAYDRAKFRVSVLQDGTTQVGVSRGRVELETEAGISDINAGEMTEITPDGQVYTSGLPGMDGWDRWVDSRWNRYKSPPRSARYLPPDMADYGYEFDEGGRWVDNPDYGYVWVPAVAPTWSPYSNGRWVFVAGDYVWLPYDPWYACFHYGRWSWSASFGWYWLPPAVSVGVWWSPGYVGWAWSGDVVSWVPLGPREIYYGYGYYGPMSVDVNVTNVTVVKNVYINSRVNNGVIVVNRNNFLRGDIKRETITRGQNPFRHPGAAQARIMPRPPARDIKPIRATMDPRPGVKPKVLPPKHVEKVLPMVRQRAIVREQGRSAFKPSSKPEKVPLRELGKKVPFAKPGAPHVPGIAPAPGAPGEKRLRPERPGVRPNVAPGERPGRPAPKGGLEKERPVSPGEKRGPGEKRRLQRPETAPERTPGEPAPERSAPPGRERPGVAPEGSKAPSETAKPEAGRPEAPGGPGERGSVRPPEEQVQPERTRPEGAPAWRRTPREAQPGMERPAPGQEPGMRRMPPPEKRPAKPKEEKKKKERPKPPEEER